MRIRHLGGCVVVVAMFWGAKFFLPSQEATPPPTTAISPVSTEFNAASARHWLREHQHNQVQLERTILRANHHP